jgi:uroporphyrin-III C-methyltransferase
MNPGHVDLVGAGPGPLDLLTLRAHRCLQQAEVLIYDRLVDPEVLKLVPPNCLCIPAGKASGHHLMPQADINSLMVEHARQGKRVVRLKGGDPNVFGRAAEETNALQQAEISFSVVPGVTAASSAAAAGGFSLTHRDLSHSCVFLAGHGAKGPLDYDWAALAKPHQTRVFYMGVERLQLIGEKLIQHGLPPSTPAALIYGAQCEEQDILACSLERLMALNPGYRSSPGLLVIGETVQLSPHFKN